ncbi:MAG: class I SAM-dependent methyltransferase [Blautia sp.]|jgi:ubiquinone/menaquinone biosynthesis C-methylase UbiE
MNSYDREKGLWNKIYADYQPVDLRNTILTVEPGFDNCLQKFGKKTSRVLDFGCGTGDILFQYIQNFPEKKGIGIDESEQGIAFAKKTAEMSAYYGLHFFTGDSSLLADFENDEFDGIILSNVLDVMPEKADESILGKLDRILAPGGCWFIKLNPYYSENDLNMFDYQKKEGHLYERDGILRLHQETTEHWKRVLGSYGCMMQYLEFVYPWQEGWNRLFLLKKPLH